MQGWVITHETDYGLSDLPSRIGWGQVSEETVRAQAEQLVAPRISLTTGIDPDTIDAPIDWRTRGDGEPEPSYRGVISQDWADGEECFAFAPLEFATADVGDVILEYRSPETGEWEVL